ncbi:hypothetical protein glysoja_000746 [Glycine soja]|nr:hypothetical protein glysoja_000746 [Glycine soja]
MPLFPMAIATICSILLFWNFLSLFGRNDERALEIEEERYFNEDSDEEDTASVPCNLKGHQQPNLSNGVAASYSHLRSLVDYEDDKDYKPPPRKQPETSEEDDGVSQAEESIAYATAVPNSNVIPCDYILMWDVHDMGASSTDRRNPKWGYGSLVAPGCHGRFSLRNN